MKISLKTTRFHRRFSFFGSANNKSSRCFNYRWGISRMHLKWFFRSSEKKEIWSFGLIHRCLVVVVVEPKYFDAAAVVATCDVSSQFTCVIKFSLLNALANGENFPDLFSVLILNFNFDPFTVSLFNVVALLLPEPLCLFFTGRLAFVFRLITGDYWTVKKMKIMWISHRKSSIL